MILSPSELLAVWEHAYPQSPPARALTLLAAARPAAPEEIVTLPVGRRDAMLLAWREETFGAAFTGVTTCRECAEPVELRFTADDVRSAAAGPAEAPDLHVRAGDRVIGFRLPDGGDLVAIAETPRETATERLLARCVGADAELAPGAAEAIEAAMEAADPMAVVQFTIACPCCGAAFTRPFDIAAFLWSEIESWAVRLIRDVHVIAAAYGWSEREILAMTPSRRQMYVGLLQ